MKNVEVCKKIFLIVNKKTNECVVVFLEKIDGEWYLVRLKDWGGEVGREEIKIDEEFGKELYNNILWGEVKKFIKGKIKLKRVNEGVR